MHPVITWLQGEYGSGPYLGVPAALGSEGARGLELPIAANELAELRRAAKGIDARQNEMEETTLRVSNRATRSPPQALAFFGSVAAICGSHRVTHGAVLTATGLDAVLTSSPLGRC